MGSEVVRIIEESADDLAARIGAPLVLRGIGVRRVADDRGVPVDLLTDDIDALVSRDDVDIVVEVMGPVEPSRKAILSALEHGKSVVTANKALLSVCHRRTGAGRRKRQRRPVFRGRRGRCHPGDPAADPVAGRRHRAAGGRHRQRHHQLHPVRDGQHRRRLRAGAGRRERARLRRSRSDRRRGRLRRRGQSRHPGVHRVPHPGDRRRRLPRGHHQDQPGRLRVRARPGLHDQAAVDLRADHHRRWAAAGFGSGLPGAGAAGASAGHGQRRVQRRGRRGRRPPAG